MKSLSTLWLFYGACSRATARGACRWSVASCIETTEVLVALGKSFSKKSFNNCIFRSVILQTRMWRRLYTVYLGKKRRMLHRKGPWFRNVATPDLPSKAFHGPRPERGRQFNKPQHTSHYLHYHGIAGDGTRSNRSWRVAPYFISRAASEVEAAPRRCNAVKIKIIASLDRQ